MALGLTLWPNLAQFFVNIWRLINAQDIWTSNKQRAGGIEARMVAMADELFAKDQALKALQGSIWDKADDMPDYGECATHPTRRRVDVIREASKVMSNSIAQPGRGQIGQRRAIIRDYALPASYEVGARMGEAQAVEMRLTEAYKELQIRSKVAATLMARYPSSLPNAFASSGAAYSRLAAMGGQMFNGALAGLGYSAGQIGAGVRQMFSDKDTNLNQAQPVDLDANRDYVFDYDQAADNPEGYASNYADAYTPLDKPFLNTITEEDIQ